MLVRAKVVKRDTADGVSFLMDEVPIGFIYHVDPDSIELMEWDLETGKITVRLSIRAYGSAFEHPRNVIGYMPSELLEWNDELSDLRQDPATL